MADDKILKPKSFRIDDETSEKFKEISRDIGGNQQDALAKLIQTYELQKGKTVLPDKKEEIEKFEKYVNILTRMYMNTLEENQNITETVRSEFDALLLSKDSTIQDLQEKITVANQTKVNAVTKVKSLTDESIEMQNYIIKLEKELKTLKDNYEDKLSDKDALNNALKDSLHDYKEKNQQLLTALEELKEESESLDKVITEYDDIIKEKTESLNKVIAERDDIIDEKSELIAKAENYEKLIDNLKQEKDAALKHAKEQAQFEKEKAIFELEKKHQEQVQNLKVHRQQEIDQYQQKYLELIEKLNLEDKETPTS